MLGVPQPPYGGPKADVQFAHLWCSNLTVVCTKKNSQWYSQTERKDMLNKCDSRCVLKVENVSDRRRSMENRSKHMDRWRQWVKKALMRLI